MGKKHKALFNQKAKNKHKTIMLAVIIMALVIKAYCVLGSTLSILGTLFHLILIAPLW